MHHRKFLLSLAVVPLLFCYSTLHAQTSTGSAVLTSVSGKVTVKRGSKTVTLHQDSKVHEGETLTTAKDAKATVRLFDGSELQVKPETKVVLAKVQKSGAADKVLKFKLLLGKLFASVQKLASSKSSFEIEAGGVVCGVRGTQYEVDYDGHEHVDLFVHEGNVWANAGGNTFQYGPGGAGHFTDGKPNNPASGDNQGQGKKGKGNQPPGPPDEPPGPPQTFNPFQGMGGNQTDPLQPLTGGAPDTGDITKKTGDANQAGLGAHLLILQFKYPEQ
jgi:hypothetical protein